MDLKMAKDQSKIAWLEDRTIILSPTGSYAYGTNTENSDKDYKSYRPNAAELLDCRNGVRTFDEAIEHIESLDEELKEVYEKSPLPATPDYHAINRMLMEINKEALEL